MTPPRLRPRRFYLNRGGTPIYGNRCRLCAAGRRCFLKTLLRLQQIDLAMLRLAFRDILAESEDGRDDVRPSPPIRQLSCSELNQLVSAVVRMHGDERELLGIKSPQDSQDSDDQYEYLEHLSTPALIQLCYKEGINPPPACQTNAQTQDTDTTGQT